MPACGLSLPCTQTISDPADALSITNRRGSALSGESNGSDGVRGLSSSDSNAGVHGTNRSKGSIDELWQPDGSGVYGETTAMGGSGVFGACTTLGTGVTGRGYIGLTGKGGEFGVVGHGRIGVLGVGYIPSAGPFTDGIAAEFNGRVYVSGLVSKGGGGFRIDHPLDPANKYLSHSFVESPDMKNMYDGIVVLNGNGEAVVTLPAWFDVLNRDFRYQLTAVGAPAPNLHIAKSISKNTFTIAGGKSKMKVCWQVTGTRKDRWAEKNRVVVEERKPPKERGHYLHPQAHGQPEEKGVLWARYPEQMERLKEVSMTRMSKSERKRAIRRR